MKARILSAISRTGVRPEDDLSKQYDILLCNQISLLLSTLPLIYIISNVYNQGWSRITIPIVLQPLGFLLPVFINYLGFTTLSRLILSWVMSLQALAFSVYNKSHGMDYQTSHYIGIQFSILASSVIPFLVFRLKDFFLILISLAVPFFAIAWFDAVHDFFGVGYYQVGLKETGYALTTMRVLIGFLLIAGSSLFLKRLVEKNEAANKKLIHNLAEKNSEIQCQLEEITSQNDQISAQRDQLANHKELIEHQNNQLTKAKDELEERVIEKSKDILKANAELERQNIQLEQFAFMAAHNLRSPVARIQGLAGLFDLEGANIDEKEKIIALIKQSSADLDEVIHDLVTIVEVRATAEKKHLKINAILDNVLESLHYDLQAHQFKIVNEINTDQEVYGNEAFLYSIFFNIVSNSIKYRHCKKSPSIAFCIKKNEMNCILEISDNGIGFDANANRDKLFKPFTKLNNNFPGKGLGLYLIKIQMESMDGNVMITSNTDTGTIVSLEFKADQG